MTADEHKKLKFSRIRRAKKWLKYMPRRATLHRYPILKIFASSARKLPFLWSFRTKEVVPALYAGFILTFMPLQGIQIILALGLAIIFRANLMILVALQLISNPLTAFIIYPLDYQVGSFFLKYFTMYGKEGAEMVQQSYASEVGSTLGQYGKKGIQWFMTTMLGGIVVGFICALISSLVYIFLRKRWRINHPLEEPAQKDSPRESSEVKSE